MKLQLVLITIPGAILSAFALFFQALLHFRYAFFFFFFFFFFMYSIRNAAKSDCHLIGVPHFFIFRLSIFLQQR